MQKLEQRNTDRSTGSSYAVRLAAARSTGPLTGSAYPTGPSSSSSSSSGPAPRTANPGVTTNGEGLVDPGMIYQAQLRLAMKRSLGDR
jgi:hypothetical protein